jgi:uncharacterized membrane protein
MRKARSFAASAHPSFADAERALAALEDLANGGVVRLDDAAIVARTAAGKVEVHQRRGLSAGAGLVGGGVAGALGGLLLGLPVAGAVLGAVAGGGLSLIDTGIDDSRLKELGSELRAGQAALCVLVADADWPALRDGMAPFTGDLLAVELTPDAEAALEARDYESR